MNYNYFKKYFIIIFLFIFWLLLPINKSLAETSTCQENADCPNSCTCIYTNLVSTTGTCMSSLNTSTPCSETAISIDNNIDAKVADAAKYNCEWTEKITKSGENFSNSGSCSSNQKNILINDAVFYCTNAIPTSNTHVTYSTDYTCCCTLKDAAIKKTPDLNPLGNLQIKIPGIDELAAKYPVVCTSTSGVESCQIPWIAIYIYAIYNYLLAIGGVLAVIALMVGGVIWLVSAGNASRVTQAKSWISGSLTGILILLTSYILLYQINPDLVGMKYTVLETVEPIVLTASEAVTSGQTKGMQCFFDTFGSNENEVKDQLVTITFLGKKIQVHQKAKAAFEAVNAELANSNYKPTMGTFMWRQNVNKPSETSLHSFGIAIDFDTKNNPNYPRTCTNKICNVTKTSCSTKEDCTCKTNIPQEVVSAFKKHGFRWGGNYKKTCDAMHFEWIEPCL